MLPGEQFSLSTGAGYEAESTASMLSAVSTHPLGLAGRVSDDQGLARRVSIDGAWQDVNIDSGMTASSVSDDQVERRNSIANAVMGPTQVGGELTSIFVGMAISEVLAIALFLTSNHR